MSEEDFKKDYDYGKLYDKCFREVNNSQLPYFRTLKMMAEATIREAYNQIGEEDKESFIKTLAVNMVAFMVFVNSTRGEKIDDAMKIVKEEDELMEKLQ